MFPSDLVLNLTIYSDADFKLWKKNSERTEYLPEGFTSEKNVQSFSILHMRFPIEEYPTEAFQWIIQVI